MCRPFVQYVINDNFNKILDYIVYFRKSVTIVCERELPCECER